MLCVARRFWPYREKSAVNDLTFVLAPKPEAVTRSRVSRHCPAPSAPEYTSRVPNIPTPFTTAHGREWWRWLAMGAPVIRDLRALSLSGHDSARAPGLWTDASLLPHFTNNPYAVYGEFTNDACIYSTVPTDDRVLYRTAFDPNSCLR